MIYLGKQDITSPWSQWSPSNHNTTASPNCTLGIDSDQDVPIAKCLPRFLCHPSQKVRLTAARTLLQSANFDAGKFQADTMPVLIENLAESPGLPGRHAELQKVSNMKTEVCTSIALTACDKSYTRHALSSVLIANRKQPDSVCVERAVKLIAYIT